MRAPQARRLVVQFQINQLPYKGCDHLAAEHHTRLCCFYENTLRCCIALAESELALPI